MKKSFVWFGLVFTALVVTSLSLLHAQRRDSSLIELCPPVSVAPTGFNVGAIPAPLGKHIRLSNRAIFVLKVSSAQSAGSALGVFFQSSSDDGQTWNDIAQVDTTSTGTYYVPVSVITAGSSTVQSISDGQLANGTVVQGPIGDLIRIRYVIVTGNSGMWSFQAFVLPH